jgi:hypothetical protein
MYSVLVHVTIQPQHVDEFISLNRAWPHQKCYPSVKRFPQ